MSQHVAEHATQEQVSKNMRSIQNHHNNMKKRPKHVTNLAKCDVKSMEIMQKGALESSFDTAGPKSAPEIDNGRQKHAVG